MSTTKPNFGFALEYVTDIEAAKSFYVDVLGLELKRYHPTYLQFENFAVASDASMSGTGESELYWLVDDAEAALKDISQRTEVTFELRQLPFGKVFAVKDPAGRPRYLLELAKDRPSAAV